MTELTCAECRELLSPLLDEELDSATRAAVTAHLEGCAGCRAERTALADLVLSVKSDLTYFAMPSGLEEQIFPAASAGAEIIPFRRRVMRWAAPVVSVAALAASLLLYLGAPNASSVSLGDEAISAHIRSLLGAHLVDVAGNGTVQPWLAAKLDFAAPVKDYGHQGFQLIGARLDYLRHREVAALAYGHDAHVVSLFVFPDTEHGLTNASRTERGYNCITWKQGELRYVEVSDISQSAMEALRADIQGNS